MDITHYTVDDYYESLEILSEEMDELVVHPWVNHLLEQRVTKLMEEMALHSPDTERMLDILNRNYITVFVLGLTMGEVKTQKTYTEVLVPEGV